MSKVERVVSCFKNGFSCSQAILSVYGEELGLDRETALKVSGGFGGGMRMGETCGAVTGALMVIGLKYCPTNAEDKKAKEKTYEVVKEFTEKFKSRNGTVICKDLLGFDLSSPEGLKLAQERGLFSSLCPKFVEEAAKILEEIL